jgi:adenosylhomocysteine nucleosidase
VVKRINILGMITDCIVLISSDIEWQIVKELVTQRDEMQTSPFGEWFAVPVEIGGESHPVIFFQGGWGKISAAASTQYVIDRWYPQILINLGTCGGFDGKIAKGEIILATQTVVYDIIEQMGDYLEHIAHYTTTIDLSWLARPYPLPVRETVLVSADKDLIAAEIPHLAAMFGAVAGDWESGAIAFVAQRNATKCLILRGVSDLVGQAGGEAYANLSVFADGAKNVLRRLLASLPQWIDQSREKMKEAQTAIAHD